MAARLMNSKIQQTLVRLGNSLIVRLIGVSIVLILIGLALRVYILIPQLQKDVADIVASQQLTIASYAARDIDAKLVARRELVQSLATSITAETLSNPANLTQWIEERQRLYPLFNRGLMVFSPDGHRVLADYPGVPERRKLDYGQSPWFLAALDSRNAVIGPPMISRLKGEPLIVMAMAVRDRSGKPLAVLAGIAVLTAPGFIDLMNEVKLGHRGGFLLISPKDKVFVSSSDPAMILKPTPPPGVNLLHDKAMAGYRGVGVTVNAQGEEELSAMVTVPSTGWYVVARIPTEEAFHPVRAQGRNILHNSMLTVTVVVLLLMVLLPWLFRPLVDAAKQMRRMASGEVAPHPLPVRRNDEVGELVLGFNSLLKKLTDQETALRKSKARLAHLALHDPLTGLPNRSMLEDRLDQALMRAQRSGQQVALLFCDLDGFKPINDHYGHDTGDAVLCLVADRLQEGRRKTDTVARLGGDEFVILLTDLDDARGAAETVAGEYVRSIAQPFVLDEKHLSLGVSIGISLYPQAGTEAPHLLTCADTAMYAAKQAGRGRYVFHG
jgi:diguanylate cyclase (GGDEF)-like protein